ncbi:dihydrofolate reductase family protein [Isoptericola sp. NPDC057391]|uniref:dihydrofolate reductase family protein n=1 Tax=Isoptericola sp. NPDC057391 TaxID=3346117 RepID=UPI0036421F77
MRTLAITQNVTVDGAVEMLDDWFDPQGQAGADDDGLLAELHRQDEASDAFLVGRRTFEDLRGYWRDLADDTTGISDYLNRVPKYVVSRTLTTPEWEPTTVLRGIDDVAALKERPGKDVVVTGSISLCHDLVRAGLVDEYRFFTYPAVQGRGRRLFPDDLPDEVRPSRLELLGAREFAGGITLARYRVPRP